MTFTVLNTKLKTWFYFLTREKSQTFWILHSLRKQIVSTTYCEPGCAVLLFKSLLSGLARFVVLAVFGVVLFSFIEQRQVARGNMEKPKISCQCIVIGGSSQRWEA